MTVESAWTRLLLKGQEFPPQFSGDLFLVVTLTRATSSSGVSLQRVHLHQPLYAALSCATRPLHRHIRPVATDSALSPFDGTAFYPCEAPPRSGRSGGGLRRLCVDCILSFFCGTQYAISSCHRRMRRAYIFSRISPLSPSFSLVCM